jgi:hypothetical protein
MRFYQLFLMVNEFSTIIEILQYLFCRMIQDPTFTPSLESVDLVPTNRYKRHVFFRIGDEYIYAPCPAYWKIEILEIPQQQEFHCPRKQDHNLLLFIQNLRIMASKRKNISVEFHQLHVLLDQLYQEVEFHCEFCPILEKQVLEMGIKPLEYIKPYYTGFRDPEKDPEELRELLKKHVRCCEIILQQTRNATLQKEILGIIHDCYLSHKKDFEHGLLEGRPVEKVYEKFKQKLQGLLMTRISFIHFKNIDFKEWFKSLFMFQLELQTLDTVASQKKETWAKKILLLLYYLFPENTTTRIESKSLIMDSSAKKKLVPVDLATIQEFHPILRGSCLVYQR